ncbi:MAG: NADH-quinone oxidoreductase subunit M [Chloroflexi bacterium]|nr:MAG: NADH-quinone oxidoreductase subunit M [Chloroflexota bacterium]RLC84947.1 MAG: NADH-quinone oxidoreductase subunit M [Chloroflexota bacterium]
MFPILSVTLLIPLAGALLIMIIPREDARTIRQVGIFFAFLSLVLATVVWILVAPNAGVMQLEEKYPWIPTFNINFHLGVDGLSAPMIFLTALLTTLSLFYSARTIKERVKEYYFLFLLLEMSMLGVFLSLDMVMYYVFWEIELVPMFLLIGVWGGKNRKYASLKFFLYTMAGSVFMLLAIIGVYFQTGTFNILDAAAAQPFAGNFTWASMAFWAFFVAFAIKVPAFPFHTWLPDAHTEAPTSGSVILAGILLKLGAYGLIRIVLPMFPAQFKYFVLDVPIVPIMAVMSIAYGAMVCMAQWDFKRLVAYSSVAHMGYVTLGLCAAAAGIGTLGIEKNFNAAASGLSGAAFQMFAHGIITGGMFFLVGIIYERAHTRELKAFGGLGNQVPYYYSIMLVTGFASLGLPGLAGFWSEFFVFRGAINFIPVAAFIGVLGVVFTAAYILWKIVQYIFLGELDKEKWGHLTDMEWWEKATIWPLIIIMVVFGLYPAPLLDSFNAAMTTILQSLP